MSAPAVTRAREDLREGRPWMARDRLQSYVATGHFDGEALELLGVVHYQMGDLPSAARFWFLTDRGDEEFERSLRALRHRLPRARARLKYLRVREPLDQYPPAARDRIAMLAAEARAEDGRETHLRSPAAGLPYARASRRERILTSLLVGLLLVALVAGTWWIVEQLVGLATMLIG